MATLSDRCAFPARLSGVPTGIRALSRMGHRRSGSGRAGYGPSVELDGLTVPPCFGGEGWIRHRATCGHRQPQGAHGRTPRKAAAPVGVRGPATVGLLRRPKREFSRLPVLRTRTAHPTIGHSCPDLGAAAGISISLVPPNNCRRCRECAPPQLVPEQERVAPGQLPLREKVGKEVGVEGRSPDLPTSREVLPIRDCLGQLLAGGPSTGIPHLCTCSSGVFPARPASLPHAIDRRLMATWFNWGRARFASVWNAHSEVRPVPGRTGRVGFSAAILTDPQKKICEVVRVMH